MISVTTNLTSLLLPMIMKRLMRCIRRWAAYVMENEAMGLYFIEDPDGYWLEIIPQR